MDNISYEELNNNLDSFFQNYTKIELISSIIPPIGFNGFLDLRYVKEDIIICKNIKYNKNGVDVLLPSHVVSIDFTKVENFRFLYFPNSLKRITIIRTEGITKLFPMYNLPDLPNELLLLTCMDCGLNNIPPLPQTLKLLDCSYNKSISRIPELPIGLMVLRCVDTTITQLPELPEGLIELSFGIGGKDKPLYFPEKLPINLEVMDIGSEDVFFDEAYEIAVRSHPEVEVELEPGETLNPQTIDKYLAKKKAESDINYTTFVNPESFIEFPPNLKHIRINGTNLSSFPIKLPDIWNTATTEEFVTEEPNPQINKWNPYPIIQTVNFSIFISGNIGINLLQQKYLPLLQNIKNLLIKHKIQPKKYLLSYYGYDSTQRINLDDLINRLQSENHASFNISVKDKPLATTQGTTIPSILNPQISQYLSSNQELQTQTVNNSKGGKYKKSKKNKKTKRLRFKKSKSRKG